MLKVKAREFLPSGIVHQAGSIHYALNSHPDQHKGRCMRVHVQQSGNSVQVCGFKEPIVFEVEGFDLGPVRDHTFAAWLLLPWAMRTGEPIEVDGPVDPVAASNMKRFSKSWELWEPQNFHTIDISGTSGTVPTQKAEDFVFYSGGLDSTDMLLQLGRNEKTATALTVHGFDYSVSSTDQFSQLRDRVAPLLEELNYRHVTMRISKMQGGNHSWALQLAGTGFLFPDHFRSGLFAADYSWEQDMMAFPWGLNHVTNRYMVGENFGLKAQCEDRTRAMKAESVMHHPLAIKAASFCKRREVRPRNCGTCEKCLRTKAMFAIFGEQPDIFIDRSFDADLLNSIDLNNKNERSFFVDLCHIARERGAMDRIPGMRERFAELKNPKRVKSS